MDSSVLLISLALIAAIGWGFSGFFDAKAARSIHPVIASLTVNAIVAIGYAIIYFIWLHKSFDLSASGVLFAISGGAVITVGAIAYFKGLHIGPVGLVSPMSSAYPLVTTLLAITVFGGRLSYLQLIAIVLIVCGVFIVTEFIGTVTSKLSLRKGPLLGLLAALCWGIGYSLVGEAIARDGWPQATLIEFTAMLAAFGICVPFVVQKGTMHRASLLAAFGNRHVIAAGLIALVAASAFNIALAHDSSSGAIVATVSSFYPIITVLLALRHFDESVGRLQLAGACASIAGVILLSVS